MVRSKKHLEKLLRCPWAELKKISSQPDNYYYKKEEFKTDKDGHQKYDKHGQPRVRTMYPSKGRLKNLHKIIKGAILSKIELPENIYGGIKGRDSVLNAKVHQGNHYKFCTDIKDFFPSITSPMVYKSLIKQGFSYDVSSMLTKLITYKDHVPQGTPTSTHIANVVLLEIDNKIIEYCREHRITYTRYVDDLAFSSQYDFKSRTHKIIEIIKSQGFRISHKKTMYAVGSMVLTGVWVRNNSLGVTDGMKDKLNHPERYTKRQIQGHEAFYRRVKSV